MSEVLLSIGLLEGSALISGGCVLKLFLICGAFGLGLLLGDQTRLSGRTLLLVIAWLAQHLQTRRLHLIQGLIRLGGWLDCCVLGRLGGVLRLIGGSLELCEVGSLILN